MKRFEAWASGYVAAAVNAARALEEEFGQRKKAKRLMRANAELEDSLARKLRENTQGQPRDMHGRYARKGAMPRA